MNRVWKVENNTGSTADIVSGSERKIVERPFTLSMRKFLEVLSPGRIVNENNLLAKFNIKSKARY